MNSVSNPERSLNCAWATWQPFSSSSNRTRGSLLALSNERPRSHKSISPYALRRRKTGSARNPPLFLSVLLLPLENKRSLESQLGLKDPGSPKDLPRLAHPVPVPRWHTRAVTFMHGIFTEQGQAGAVPAHLYEVVLMPVCSTGKWNGSRKRIPFLGVAHEAGKEQKLELSSSKTKSKASPPFTTNARNPRCSGSDVTARPQR